MSLSKLYLHEINASGAIYKGEPIFYSRELPHVFCGTTKPKSPILISDLFTKMLSGLISLCIKPYLEIDL